MPVIQISGNYAKGVARSDNEEESKEFMKKLLMEGARVSISRKYETFMKERLEVDPPLHTIRWTYE